MENNKKYTIYVKLRPKIERIIQKYKNNTKIYIQLLHNMQCYFSFYAKRTNDNKLIFNASKLPLVDAHSTKRHYKDITLHLPLSGEEKSKANADDERDYKKKASTDTRANCTTEYTQRSITTNLNDPKVSRIRNSMQTNEAIPLSTYLNEVSHVIWVTKHNTIPQNCVEYNSFCCTVKFICHS